MEVLLSSPRGFCAGVVRAIDVVDVCLRRYGPPVYVKHQIVHNPYVVNDLEARGAIRRGMDEVRGFPLSFRLGRRPDFEKRPQPSVIDRLRWAASQRGEESTPRGRRYCGGSARNAPWGRWI